MAASVEGYLSIIGKAYDGRLKLPAFQRDWKWKTGQVILLFDSLRQGFPIGSFLFISENKEVDLSPREFRGASPSAASEIPESMVLDGQQRITAGLELFYGEGPTQYFIDIEKLYKLFSERGGSTSDTASIRKFLSDLDADDQYCRARKSSSDPESALLKSHLLWTRWLMDEIELDRLLRKYWKKFPDREEFVSLVVGKNFRPSLGANIPVTHIDGDVTVEAISRIFSTLNSTGKMLTPFELVVSILFPHSIDLAEDVQIAKAAFPYYGRIDQSGDILLQTVALFADKDTRKASLPKTITPELYNLHANDAAKFLDAAARLVSAKVGLGLDESSELLVYPVIFPPMAYILKVLDGKYLSVPERAAIEHKIARWFIGSVLTRRYQQSTHDKQARDKTEILRWINDENATPQWLQDAYIPNLKVSDPDGAVGKLLRALVNSHGLKDPLSGKSIGVGSGKQTSAKHHIFPTRFVPSLTGWKSKEHSANLALNIMYLEDSTNAAWLNLDPAAQLANALSLDDNPERLRSILQGHAISEASIEIMRRPSKSVNDFHDFLDERERSFVALLGQWGFVQPATTDEADPLEVVED